jgi:hypothetical protein
VRDSPYAARDRIQIAASTYDAAWLYRSILDSGESVKVFQRLFVGIGAFLYLDGKEDPVLLDDEIDFFPVVGVAVIVEGRSPACVCETLVNLTYHVVFIKIAAVCKLSQSARAIYAPKIA